MTAPAPTGHPQIPVFTAGTGLRRGVDPSSNAALLDAVDNDEAERGGPIDAGL